MALNILRKEKSAEILLALMGGAKGVRELQRMVGGSNETVYQRIKDLLEAGLIEDEYLARDVFGEKPRDSRLLRITIKGKELAQSIVISGFARPILLRKLRERWIIGFLRALGTISGTTRFMKLLFVLKNELGLTERELAGFYSFRAGKYGPFSRGVQRDLEELKDLGFIEVEVRKVAKGKFNEDLKYVHVYKMAPKRIDIIQEASENLPKDILLKLERLKEFNRMPLIELLEYVYLRYPEYIRNSVIVERILRDYPALPPSDHASGERNSSNSTVMRKI